MAASPALLSLSLSPVVSRQPHLLFSHSHSPRHLRLAPPAASASPSPSPSPEGGGGGGVFLSPSALSQLDALADFRYAHSFPHGSLTVRALTPADDAEADALVRLLASSFSEDVRWAPAQRYARLLAFVIRRYLHERRGFAPHAAVLVGFYRPAAAEDGEEGEDHEDEGEMACTAEVSLDAMGAPGAPPTPTPPPEFPYICNMTVKTSLRRRGIGKQLLKACEDLVLKMDAKRHVYLHCRIIDQVPFNMYRKAGYDIVQTDSILVWLSLQKRKHLMRKELPQASVGSYLETNTKHLNLQRQLSLEKLHEGASSLDEDITFKDTTAAITTSSTFPAGVMKNKKEDHQVLQKQARFQVQALRRRRRNDKRRLLNLEASMDMKMVNPNFHSEGPNRGPDWYWKIRTFT